VGGHGGLAVADELDPVDGGDRYVDRGAPRACSVLAHVAGSNDDGAPVGGDEPHVVTTGRAASMVTNSQDGDPW
jgi:hypothetical protein